MDRRNIFTVGPMGDMTDPIRDARQRLPPDPFAADVHAVQKPAPSVTPSSLLPRDPYAAMASPAVDYARVSRAMGAGAAVARNLDAVRDAYSGPYHVAGQTVYAPPQFRMSGGINHRRFFNVDEPNQHDAAAFQRCLTPQGKAVYGILARGGVANPGGVMLGYGSPAALVKATQALCAAGKLLSLPPPATLSDCIRKMQWDNGIGVDCVDFCMSALAGVKGRSVDSLGLQRGTDPFGPDGRTAPPHFTRVDARAVHPGDIVTLKDPDPKEVGHRVIVRDAALVSGNDPKCAAIAQRWGSTAARFFQSAGSFRIYTVDSSWGAEDGKAFGGYRSDTWVRNETTGTWMSFSPHTADRGVLVSSAGPAGEIFAGAYRFGGS